MLHVLFNIIVPARTFLFRRLFYMTRVDVCSVVSMKNCSL